MRETIETQIKTNMTQITKKQVFNDLSQDAFRIGHRIKMIDERLFNEFSRSEAEADYKIEDEVLRPRGGIYSALEIITLIKFGQEFMRIHNLGWGDLRWN